MSEKFKPAEGLAMRQRKREEWYGTSKPAWAVIIGLLSALLVAACGVDDNGGEPAPEDTVGEAAPGDTAPERPVEPQGTLAIAMPLSITTLNIHDSADRSALIAGLQIFDTLVIIEGDEYVPSLAQSWHNPDENTWVFDLREDARFHDGSQVTARDVQASLQAIIEGGGPLASLWVETDAVEVTDEYTISIRTNGPVASLLSNLALVMIGPADQIDDEAFWRNPVGSGPFVVEEFLPSERLILSANRDHWGGPPHVERLEFRDIPEMSSRLTAMETGEIDLTWSIPPDFIDRLEANDDIVYEVWPSYNYYFAWINGNHEPLNDQRVRQALWHAVDFETILEDLAGGLVTPARAPIPQAVVGAATLDPYTYDPDRARELLADAGYPDGFSTSLNYNSPSGPLLHEFASAMASYWAQVGVNVELRDMERAAWVDELRAVEFDINMQTNAVLTGDASYTLGRLFPCDAPPEARHPFGRSGHCSQELDELLRAADRTLDQRERDRIFADAQQLIWDQVIAIFPGDLGLNTAVNVGVTGFEMPPSELPRFSNVRVSDNR